jgi:hypothetical protein
MVPWHPSGSDARNAAAVESDSPCAFTVNRISALPNGTVTATPE